LFNDLTLIVYVFAGTSFALGALAAGAWSWFFCRR
jgi:hypothetical protein